MNDNDLLCDDLALWELQTNEAIKKMESCDFRMYLKIMLYYPYSENDIDTITMTYIQVSLILCVGSL